MTFLLIMRSSSLESTSVSTLKLYRYLTLNDAKNIVPFVKLSVYYKSPHAYFQRRTSAGFTYFTLIFYTYFILFIPEVVPSQARPGMYVEHVIIASVHNTKHLKDTSRAFYKMV